MYACSALRRVHCPTVLKENSVQHGASLQCSAVKRAAVKCAVVKHAVVKQLAAL